MGQLDDLLDAVVARIQQVERTRDLTPVLEPGALEQANLLANVLEHTQDRSVMRARHALGWLHWYRYQALPEDLDEEAGDTALAMLTPCFLAGIGNLPEPLLPVLADQVMPTAVTVLQEALTARDSQLLTVAAELWTRIVDATPNNHPDQALRLLNFELVLFTRFELTGSLADLDGAVIAGRRAVDATSADDPDRVAILSSFGETLYSRHRRTGSLGDLDDAIAVVRQALDASSFGYPEQSGCLSSLGIALRVRFKRTGSLADLNEAITVGREAVEATPADRPARAAYLSNLVPALLARFERTGSVADLKDAITAGREAVDATPPDHPSRPGRLSNLAAALHARFERTGSLAELDDAITAVRELVDVTPADHVDRAAYLSNLVPALLARFERTGSVADLKDAITAGREAVDATPPDHPSRPGRLSNLAAVLHAHFGRFGLLADLDDAIATWYASVEATPADHPNRASHLSNLGAALRARFGRTGSLADLNEAITAGREAVDGTPAVHPDRAAYLTNLGIALHSRFGRTGSLADLNEAITAGREAVDGTPAVHPDRASRLSNLGLALSARFNRAGALRDLDGAVTAGREAVGAIPADHPDRPAYLSNLGSALQMRFGRTELLADLEEVIAVGREAVDASPTDHPERAGNLSNLGNALYARFRRTEMLAELDDAIAVGREAVDASPTDHPERAGILSNLGIALRARFEQTVESKNLHDALKAFTEASRIDAANPSLRINCARAAADLAAPTDPTTAANLLEEAILLLPEMAPRHLQRNDQHYAIGKISELANVAAALALTDPTQPAPLRARRALGLLEAGRAVLLGQGLDARSDLTDLRRTHPDLAMRFTELRDALDQGSDTAPLPRSTFDDRTVDRRIGVAADLAAHLAHIRTLDGFTTFASAPTVEELLAEAVHGPIVTFIVSSHRSEALLLTSDGITALPLPGLALEMLVTQVNTFHQALQAAASRGADGAADRITAQDRLVNVLGWLWDNATGPVLDALGLNTTPSDQEWPRIWWAPGGLLGLLPLHAAGYHADAATPQRRTVIDRVVSSYTPTIRALRYARQRTTVTDEQARSLIVAMPTTPGLPHHGRLAHVADEAELLNALLPDALTLTEPEPATSDESLSISTANPEAEGIPTRARVFEELPHCAIAHFACHGTNDPANPASSCLLLHDHAEAPLTVASLAPVNLDHAQLAYLSACNTALNTANSLLDEAIHLTGAFQLAGFPHVIGTLWTLDDEIAVDIACDFYTELLDTGTGQIDVTRAAHALHSATRTQRDQYCDTPSLWAAHLHTGA